MFALMSWLKGGSEAASPAAAIMPVASDGIVLPRFLRRPARLLGRLTDGNFEAPRYSASILTIGLLSVAGIYGAYLGGQFPMVVQSVTSRLGFAIDEVKVSGNHQTSEIDILDRLELDGWTSLILGPDHSTPHPHQSGPSDDPPGHGRPSWLASCSRWTASSSWRA